ncbi:hypothetical protein [Flagellimonas okinawensis]|uniref:Uncharacterized protein n=1 Tax=Flagellimonas okinawensis TaxID=3031324 RepID=A0ABT5XJF9_9FLAO|nr:hypothetical protein [[Muricauda] okinawensis]MDF0705821.1 hypothetical protein [[Muricauda] okinawensis]
MNSSKSKNQQLTGYEVLDKLDSLATRLNNLESKDCENIDEIVTINEQMRRIIEDIYSNNVLDELITAAHKETHQIVFASSEDKNVGVFSWESKLDCLGHNIKNIALFRSNNRVSTSSLYGKSMMYSEVSLLKNNNNKMLYQLKGTSHFGENKVNGYTISNGQLIESQIPNKAVSRQYANSTLEE